MELCGSAIFRLLDSLDLGRTAGRWELSLSTGLFCASGQSSTLVGPQLVGDAARDAWRLSARDGSTFEVRLSRRFSL